MGQKHSVQDAHSHVTKMSRKRPRSARKADKPLKNQGMGELLQAYLLALQMIVTIV